jgi:hypothetical protein
MSGQGKPARFFVLDEVGRKKPQLVSCGEQGSRQSGGGGARERVEWAESGRDISLSSATLFLP